MEKTILRIAAFRAFSHSLHPTRQFVPGHPERRISAALPPFGCLRVNESNRPQGDLRCPALTAHSAPNRPLGPGRIGRGGRCTIARVTVRRDREVELDIGLGLAEGARCERTSEEVACFSRQADLKNSQANATFAYSVHKVIEPGKLGWALSIASLPT